MGAGCKDLVLLQIPFTRLAILINTPLGHDESIFGVTEMGPSAQPAGSGTQMRVSDTRLATSCHDDQICVLLWPGDYLHKRITSSNHPFDLPL
jgi:hypothetical protein